jgi:hypothetical protein
MTASVPDQEIRRTALRQDPGLGGQTLDVLGQLTRTILTVEPGDH